MANYNTFVIVECKSRKIVLVTSSARLAESHFVKGVRVEVWNGNRRTEKIYQHDKKRERNPLEPYIQMERNHLREKQARAEARNRRIRHNKGS